METNHAKDQASAHLESIKDLLENYKISQTSEEIDEDDALQAITESVLSVRMRSQWHNVGSIDEIDGAEYELLLSTGGPAVRIIGTLDQHATPDTAHLEYQDWGTVWTELDLSAEDTALLLEYAQHFYFEE